MAKGILGKKLGMTQLFDPETGRVEIINYQVVDDFGVIVNPILLLGQIHGGIVQGAGQALVEGAHYSPDGQLLTATLMDYAVPRADGMPSFKFETRNVPSTSNPLGIKGAGEAGVIPSSAVFASAIEDAERAALPDFRVTAMPISPSELFTHRQALRQEHTS